MSPTLPQLNVGPAPLSIEDVLRVASGHCSVALDPDPAWRARMNQSAAYLAQLVDSGQPIYGVTTGFGESCTVAVAPAHAADLAANLTRFHGCGVGRMLTPQEAAATMLVRTSTLAQGWSGVRLLVLERLCELLRLRILPCIPIQGSVGASGDLTPLSYVAALLMGEREAIYDSQIVPAATALQNAGLTPLQLGPKESLAIMNGTAMMTALACTAFDRAQRLARLASALTALYSQALAGNPAHFDRRIFAAKPHPGQAACAQWIRDDLAATPATDTAPARLQDRYSIRCAPHVIGALLDGLSFARQIIETEINGVDDNPLLDPATGEVLHGGNFYGGHIALIMDMLKPAIASLADLIDRQLALLCDPRTSHGLPSNLVWPAGEGRTAHHGFKAMQIAASALTAEALKATMPATAFSRSTECHNQDKVSMGTIAAHDCLKILDLSETVAAISLLAGCQAMDLRGLEQFAAPARRLHTTVRTRVPRNDADRRQDLDIHAVLDLYHTQALPIPAPDFPPTTPL